MDIGVGLPNIVPGVDRAGIVGWARFVEWAHSADDGAGVGKAAVGEAVEAFGAAGAGEPVRFPTSADPARVDPLAEIAFG